MLAQHVQVEKDQVPSQASDEEDVAYTINETKWPTGEFSLQNAGTINKYFSCGM